MYMKKVIFQFEYFKTTGVLIDCTNYSLEEEIGIEVLRDVEIKQGSFVIFKNKYTKETPIWK